MKLLLHSAAVAGGLSFLCCLGFIEPLISNTHSWLYHDSSAPAKVFAAVLINLALVWLVLTLLFWFVNRSLRTRVWLWSSLMLFAPSLILRDLSLLLGWAPPNRLALAVFCLSGVCWIASISLWRPTFSPIFERIERFAKTLLAFAGLFGLLGLGQMLWYFVAAGPMQSPGVLHSPKARILAASRTPKPRVIWVILDELSYRQVYEHRFPSLDLPAFDRLAGQSTVFTHVVPAANFTEIAVPSLVTGLPADRVRLGEDGALLSLHNPVTGDWHRFEPRDTVFEDALDHGYSTAVAGWYNPYCRILPEVLDRCQWIFREGLAGGMISDNSLMSNVVAPWMYLLNRLRSPRDGANWKVEQLAQGQIDDYTDLSSAADRLLEDSNSNFLLLHMPIPHPGGIYDRRTGTFTTRQASYIDNLALADRYLAHVRHVLEQRGEWDSSAVVVMGDHSWRTSLLWKSSPYWTAEDEAASDGGQFDDRPAYIVKLPNQAEGAHIGRQFEAVRTRALLAGILDGGIRSIAGLKAFAGEPNPDQQPRGGLQAAGGSHQHSDAGRGAS